MRWALLSLFVAASAGRAQAAPPLVVLDPGHGGSNLGTRGPNSGPYEKTVTLAIARRVAARLEAAGVHVVLTRRSDRFVTLRERVDVANRSGASLLVSIHANACSSHDEHGFELYLPSPAATDVLARATAPGDPAGVQSILEDAERGSAQEESAPLAVALHRRLLALSDDPASDRGIKQASYDVLVGPRMPAVLVEVGFLDGAGDAPRLTSGAGQDEIADALARGILDALGADGAPSAVPLARMPPPHRQASPPRR